MKTFSPARVFFFTYGAIIAVLGAAVMASIALRTPDHVRKLQKIAMEADAGSRKAADLRADLETVIESVGFDNILNDRTGGEALLYAGLRIQELEARENSPTQ